MMMAGLAPIDTSDKVFSITPSSMSAGAVTAISGFTLGADAYEVKTTSAYGSTAKVFGLTGSYLGGPLPTQPLFETKAKSRDVVVRTWSRLGMFLLRCDRSTGRAIYVSWTGQSTNGSLYVGYASDVPATFDGIQAAINTIGTTELFRTENLASYVTGWNTSATDGDEFEISVIGSTITVKWNSQTVFTSDVLFCHMVPGTVLYATTISEGALRDTEITFKASAPTYTDGDNRILDFRDWGFKQLTTTGSMSAASTTLTVASSTGFAIGDRIVVEIGGEAGAGLRNTVGVGGTWPRDRYANVASLPDPAVYREDNGGTNVHVWVEDVSSVYINYLETGDVPTWGEWTDSSLADPVRARGYWHTTQLWPLALKATITNIVGNTITLDAPSVVATTNANVYYDCTWIWDYLMPNSRYAWASPNDISNDVWEVRFPSGDYCMHGSFYSPWNIGWTFKGAGRANTELFAPKGTESPYYTINGEDFFVSDMKVRGWVGENYVGFNDGAAFPSLAYRYAFNTGGTYKNGGTFRRIDVENTWGGIQASTRFGALISDCTGTQSNGNLQQYASWFFNMSYCDENSWMEDITYTADKVGTAMEIFQQNGGGVRRCTLNNGLFASNSSGGGFLVDEISIDVDFHDLPTQLAWIVPNSSPSMNINTNIGGGAYNPGIIAGGGAIRNPTITVVKGADGSMGSGININSGAVNITVEGTHPAKPGQGVITMSNYEVGDAGRGACGILSDLSGTVVRGIRVIGDADADEDTFANISIRTGDSTLIEDCVADQISLWNGSAWVRKVGTDGNITNAEYEAL